MFVFSPSAQQTWIWMKGPDAKDFLHRLTTVNVRNLIPGEGAKGCLLDPQGRFKALFQLWNTAPDEYGFELDAGSSGQWRQSFLQLLDQFTFGERYTLTEPARVEGDFTSVWVFHEKGEEPPNQDALIRLETTPEGQVWVADHGNLDFGLSWISVNGPKAAVQSWAETQAASAQTVDFAGVERWRVLATRPRVDAEITETINPLEAGLRDAVAENKGCYPGQEVIEKIVALGSPAKRLAQIRGAGPPPAVGQALFNEATPPIEIGTLTSVASLGDGQYAALAVLRKTHAKEGLSVRLASGTAASVAHVAPYA